jgi:hypothetical protein
VTLFCPAACPAASVSWRARTGNGRVLVPLPLRPAAPAGSARDGGGSKRRVAHDQIDAIQRAQERARWLRAPGCARAAAAVLEARGGSRRCRGGSRRCRCVGAAAGDTQRGPRHRVPLFIRGQPCPHHSLAEGREGAQVLDTPPWPLPCQVPDPPRGPAACTAWTSTHNKQPTGGPPRMRTSPAAATPRSWWTPAPSSCSSTGAATPRWSSRPLARAPSS